MNEIKNKVIGENTTPDTKTIYADDIGIWDTSRKLIEKRLSKLDDILKEYGLKIN